MQQYRRALEINPANVDVLSNLGNALARLNRLDDALDVLRRALASDRDYPDAHYNIAHALAAKGDAAQAMDHYRRALALRPDWPQVRAEFESFRAAHPGLLAAP